MTKTPEYYIFLSSVTGDVRVIKPESWELRDGRPLYLGEKVKNTDEGWIALPHLSHDVPYPLIGYTVEEVIGSAPLSVIITPTDQEPMNPSFLSFISSKKGTAHFVLVAQEGKVVGVDYVQPGHTIYEHGVKIEVSHHDETTEEKPVTAEELEDFVNEHSLSFPYKLLEHFDIKRKK